MFFLADGKNDESYTNEKSQIEKRSRYTAAYGHPATFYDNFRHYSTYEEFPSDEKQLFNENACRSSSVQGPDENRSTHLPRLNKDTDSQVLVYRQVRFKQTIDKLESFYSDPPPEIDPFAHLCLPPRRNNLMVTN